MTRKTNSLSRSKSKTQSHSHHKPTEEQIQLAREIDIPDECNCPLETVCVNSKKKCPGIEHCFTCVLKAPKCHHVKEADNNFCERFGVDLDDELRVLRIVHTLASPKEMAEPPLPKPDIALSKSVRIALYRSRHHNKDCRGNSKPVESLFHPKDIVHKDDLAVQALPGRHQESQCRADYAQLETVEEKKERLKEAEESFVGYLDRIAARAEENSPTLRALRDKRQGGNAKDDHA